MRAETRGKQRKCKQCTSDDHRPPMPGLALAADREARRDLKAGAGQPALFFRRLRKDAQRRCALHIRYFQSTLFIGGMLCAIHKAPLSLGAGTESAPSEPWISISRSLDPCPLLAHRDIWLHRKDRQLSGESGHQQGLTKRPRFMITRLDCDSVSRSTIVCASATMPRGVRLK